jgi:hypothetical protein
MDIALSVLLIGSAVFCIYYWVDFYITGGVHVIKDDWYIKFQNSFPAADLWMSTCAILGAVGLLTEQTYGVLFALLAASSMIFLGLMDVTFNIQNRLYRLVASSGQMKFEVFINVYALGFGIALIICLGPRLAIV